MCFDEYLNGDQGSDERFLAVEILYDLDAVYRLQFEKMENTDPFHHYKTAFTDLSNEFDKLESTLKMLLGLLESGRLNPEQAAVMMSRIHDNEVEARRIADKIEEIMLATGLITKENHPYRHTVDLMVTLYLNEFGRRWRNLYPQRKEELSSDQDPG